MTDIVSGKYNKANTLSNCNAGYLNSTITMINAAGGLRMPVGPCNQDTWGVGADIENGFTEPPAAFKGEWIWDGFNREFFYALISNESKNSYFWEVVHQSPLHDVPNDRCKVITYDTIPHDLLYVGTTTAPTTDEQKAEQVSGARIYNCTPFVSRPDKAWASSFYTNVLQAGLCCIGATYPLNPAMAAATCKSGICFDNGMMFTLPECFKNFPDGTTIEKCFAHVKFPNFRKKTTEMKYVDNVIFVEEKIVQECVAGISIFAISLNAAGELVYRCIGSMNQPGGITSDCWVDITDMARIMFQQRSMSVTLGQVRPEVCHTLGFMIFPTTEYIDVNNFFKKDFRALLETFMKPVKSYWDGGQLTGISSDPVTMFEWSVGAAVEELYVEPSYPVGTCEEANPPAFIETKSRDKFIGQPVFPPMN